MKPILVITLALVLSACATCRREPVACVVGAAAVVAAGVYASHNASSPVVHTRRGIDQPGCGAACEE